MYYWRLRYCGQIKNTKIRLEIARKKLDFFLASNDQNSFTLDATGSCCITIMLANEMASNTGREGLDSVMAFGFGSFCKLSYRPILANVAAFSPVFRTIIHASNNSHAPSH